MATADDQHTNHRYYCDFLLKSLTETANAVTKAAAFYLAIMAALTGYIISQRLAPAMRDLTFFVESAVSLFAVITGAAVGVGLHRGLNTYRKALRALDPALYDQLRIDAFCRRGLRTLWITIGCFFIMIAIFIFGLTRLRFLSHDHANA